MTSQLVELKDGILMEVDIPEDQLRQISGSSNRQQVDTTIDALESILLKVCKPIINTFDELNKDMTINEVEIEIGLGFEVEGSFFIAKGKTNTSLTIKLKLIPKL